MRTLGTIPTLAIVLLAAGCGADAPTDPPPDPTLGHLVARDSLTMVDGRALPCCADSSGGHEVSLTGGTLQFYGPASYTDTVYTPAGAMARPCPTAPHICSSGARRGRMCSSLPGSRSPWRTRCPRERIPGSGIPSPSWTRAIRGASTRPWRARWSRCRLRITSTYSRRCGGTDGRHWPSGEGGKTAPGIAPERRSVQTVRPSARPTARHGIATPPGQLMGIPPGLPARARESHSWLGSVLAVATVKDCATSCGSVPRDANLPNRR